MCVGTLWISIFLTTSSTNPERPRSILVGGLRSGSYSSPWTTSGGCASWRASIPGNPNTGVGPRRDLQRSRCSTTPRTFDSCCTSRLSGLCVTTIIFSQMPKRQVEKSPKFVKSGGPRNIDSQKWALMFLKLYSEEEK